MIMSDNITRLRFLPENKLTDIFATWGNSGPDTQSGLKDTGLLQGLVNAITMRF